MTRAEIIENIRNKNSYLCIGLDTDLDKIPKHLLRSEDPVFEFNRQIIDATRDLCVAYKPNMAFYEAYGVEGWKSLIKTDAYLGSDHFKIADAKRGDIGNTSERYARAFFDQMSFDAITVAPYMGEDSVKPFLYKPGKWVIVLAHTSNPGSQDFQLLESDGKPLYASVIKKTCQWADPESLMFVVGATHADRIGAIRQLAPDHFFLVPGVGAQGGSLEAVSKQGLTSDCGLLVNASRSILYASAGEDFADAARKEALALQQEMQKYMELYM
jgi:orotidine-5'-phosphate decarboxylase